MMEIKLYTDEEIYEESFVIDAESKADWVGKIILQRDARIEAYDNAVDQEIEKLKAMKQTNRDKEYSATVGLEEQLMYYIQHHPAAKKAKASTSLTLPRCRLRFVYPTQTFEANKEKLIEKYDGTEYVDYKPNLKWSELKKTLAISENMAIDTTTGETIDEEYISVIDVPAKLKVEG